MSEKSKPYLWVHLALFFLGLWLIAFPLTFSLRSTPLSISDGLSGLFLLFLGWRGARAPSLFISGSLVCIGIWLQLAPLVFWAPEPLSYLNDTLVSVVIIACVLLLSCEGKEEKQEVPPGWSYNPSSWLQRLPLFFFGFIAWMCARYMTAYQLGYIDTIWDPVFGDGTEKVITSKVSQLFPVPDAGLGAFAYTLEVLMALHGGTARWRTTPWFVLLFAFLVIPVGLASIILIILQPLVVGYWCFWCLLTAACMLMMIVLAIDELVAVRQFLKRTKEDGMTTFWKGGECPGATKDGRTPSFSSPRLQFFSAMFWGVSFRWNLILSILLGGWLLFSPALFAFPSAVADGNHIAGALTIVVMWIALAEVARPLRWGGLLFGAYALVAGLLCSVPLQILSQALVGTGLILLSLRKGTFKESYGP